MVSKCANPSCSAFFRYLREGKIFHVVAGPRGPEKDSTSATSTHERFWLCGEVLDQDDRHFRRLWNFGSSSARSSGKAKTGAGSRHGGRSRPRVAFLTLRRTPRRRHLCQRRRRYPARKALRSSMF